MLEDKIISFIKESTKCEDIKGDTLLLDTKLLDSLQLIQLIMFIEKDLNINIKQEDLNPDNFKSVEAIVSLIKSCSDTTQ